MYNVIRILSCLILPLLVVAPVCAETLLQDGERAVDYFKDELEHRSNPYEVRKHVEGATDKITIVDVRAAKDYAAGHIPGAINIPYDQHEGFHGSEKSFPGLRKDGYNYVYCYSHTCNLAQKAAKKFASLGYPVKEMVGGFSEWQRDGHPIEK